MRKTMYLPEKPRVTIFLKHFFLIQKKQPKRTEWGLNIKSSITQTKEKGKEKKEKHSADPEHSGLLHTRPAWENTHQASKFRVNLNDPSGTVFWLSLLRDTGRDFRLQRSLWTAPGAMGDKTHPERQLGNMARERTSPFQEDSFP